MSFYSRSLPTCEGALPSLLYSPGRSDVCSIRLSVRCTLTDRATHKNCGFCQSPVQRNPWRDASPYVTSLLRWSADGPPTRCAVASKVSDAEERRKTAAAVLASREKELAPLLAAQSKAKTVGRTRVVAGACSDDVRRTHDREGAARGGARAPRASPASRRRRHRRCGAGGELVRAARSVRAPRLPIFAGGRLTCARRPVAVDDFFPPHLLRCYPPRLGATGPTDAAPWVLAADVYRLLVSCSSPARVARRRSRPCGIGVCWFFAIAVARFVPICTPFIPDRSFVGPRSPPAALACGTCKALPRLRVSPPQGPMEVTQRNALSLDREARA